MKRLLSILLPGVFLFSLLLTPSLRAETYTVMFDGDDPDSPQVGTLRWAIAQANANPGSTININYDVGTITFAGQSPLITAPVTINGNWNTISGNDAERIFFIDMPNAADAVRINNVTLANGYAKGGDGGVGSGGGGLGAGGAIFVNRGAVSVSNVSFLDNSAEGGKGGAVLISSGGASSAGGGGGGLGGNGGAGRIFGVGGDSGGGGGYGGNGGNAGSAAGGGGGLIGNGGSGLRLSTGHKGGGGGGGLGDGGNAYEKDVWAEPQGIGVMGGTGGSGGGGQGGNTQFVSPGANGSLYGGGGGAAHGPTYTYDPGQSPSNAGDGGKFGGGGGAVETLSGGQSNAGDGGDFGGGGGNPSYGRAGNGGFGGGGGGSSYSPSSGAASSGSGGFGGGAGGAYYENKRGTRGILGGEGGSYQTGGLGAGGGGGAAGGAIFVRSENGASLVFESGDIGGGSATAGAAGDGDAGYTYHSTAGKAAGTGIFINGGSLTVNATSGVNIYDTIFDAAFDGGQAGSLVKNGEGQLYLGGANGYAGGTTLNAGVLTVGHAQALGVTGAVNMNGGTLAYSGITTDFSSRFSTAASQQYRISIFGSTVTFATALNSAGGLLEKKSTGTLILTADNTYSGGTTISGGTLQLGAGGTTGSILGNIDNNGTLVFDRSNQLTHSGAISGSGIVVKNGIGSLGVSGANSYSGGTVLNSGILSIESDTALGTGTITINGGNIRAGGGPRTLNNNLILNNSFTLGRLTYFTGSATLTDNIIITSANPDEYAPATSGFSGVISGNFGITFTEGENPFGTIILGGNNSYTGQTTINAGTVRLTGNTASSGFAIASGAVLELNQASGTLEYGTAMTISGAGTLRKTGAGQTIWGASAATFSLASGGLIDVQGGMLVVGSWANEDWSANRSDLNVASGATFYGAEADVRVDALTGSGVIMSGLDHAAYDKFTFGVDNGSGIFAGSLRDTDAASGHIARYVKTGTGTQILTGANTFTGQLAIENGTLQIGDGGTGGSVAGDIANNAVLAFNRADGYSYSGVISGTGIVTKDGGGTLTLTGVNTSTGQLTIKGGTLQIGDGATSGSVAGDIANNAVLAFNRADGYSYSGVISGTGIVTKNGGGMLTLTGTNTYSGGTTIDAGTLSITTDANLGALSGALTINGGTLRNTAPLTTSRQIIIGPNGATFENGGGYLTLTSPLSGSGGITRTGGGLLTLHGNQSYTGATIISNGHFKVQDGTLASSSVSLALGSHFYAINMGSYAGAITGAGDFQSDGYNALSGSNSYTGGTIIHSGTLRASHKNALGTNTVRVEGGVFFVDNGVQVDNAIILSGAGYQRSLSGNLAHAVDATSDLGQVNTTARILSGTSAATTLITSFSTTSSALNDEIRLSDVYALAGTGSNVFVNPPERCVRISGNRKQRFRAGALLHFV